MKPTKCPGKEKIYIMQEKRMERGGEKVRK